MILLVVEKVSSTQNASSFLQSDFWARFKENHGWASFHLCVKYENGKTNGVFYFTLLTRCLFSSFFIGYVPMFPNVLPNVLKEENAYPELLTAITKAFYKEFNHKLVFVRFDLDLSLRVDNAMGEASHSDKAERPHLNLKKANGFHLAKTKTDIQPPDTVILDLTLNLDELSSQFKSKWRYNIRLSEKKGCTVKKLEMKTDEEIETGISLFYNLYKTTSSRDGIAIHSKEYDKDLFFLAGEYQDVSVRLYVAFYGEQALGAIITMFYKDEATYLYGASSNEKRNLMPTYLLQWQAIMDAKEWGAKTYDFYGIPPIDDPHHPMAGLYRFKTGFGGVIVHRIGSIDVYKSRFLYRLYSFIEALRSFYFKKIKKLFKRR